MHIYFTIYYTNIYILQSEYFISSRSDPAYLSPIRTPSCIYIWRRAKNNIIFFPEMCLYIISSTIRSAFKHLFVKRPWLKHHLKYLYAKWSVYRLIYRKSSIYIFTSTYTCFNFIYYLFKNIQSDFVREKCCPSFSAHYVYVIFNRSATWN